MIFYNPFMILMKSNVFSYSLDEPELSNLEDIRNWILSKNPANDKSTHVWYINLPPEIKKKFYDISLCKKIINSFTNHFGNDIIINPIFDMNEVYVSAPANVKDTSDKIFFTRHIDGPYFYMPFSYCYRMIIGMDDNEEITTCFDMVPYEKTIKKGDVIAFDFHRECHYIKKNEMKVNKDFRVVLKVHYCIYPKWACYFGELLAKLSVHYDKNFRNLFLFTISPETFFEKNLARYMIFMSKVVHDIEYYIGYNNLMITFLSYLFRNIIFDIFIIIINMKYESNNLIIRRDMKYYTFLFLMIILNKLV